MEKISVRQLAQYWKKHHHEASCNPDEPIVLGSVEEIDLEDKGDDRIWVDNGQVLLFVNCPGAVHEHVSQELSWQVQNACREAGILDFVSPGGSTSWYVENQLACHSKFQKEADFSLTLIESDAVRQKYPVLVAEVAAHHESLHHLLCEAAAWLNNCTDVLYCVAIKLYPASDKIHLLFLERSCLPSQNPYPPPGESQV
jgi:hypothetical protein